MARRLFAQCLELSRQLPEMQAVNSDASIIFEPMAIICGPGDINQAHKPNEYIEIDQIAKCEAFMQSLMERVCIAP